MCDLCHWIVDSVNVEEQEEKLQINRRRFVIGIDWSIVDVAEREETQTGSLGFEDCYQGGKQQKEFVSM